jgi:hypothetical protein
MTDASRNPNYSGGRDQSTEVRCQPGQKVLETSISTNEKVGMMLHTCHPSFVGSINRRISVQD